MDSIYLLFTSARFLEILDAPPCGPVPGLVAWARDRGVRRSPPRFHAQLPGPLEVSAVADAKATLLLLARRFPYEVTKAMDSIEASGPDAAIAAG